MNCKYCLSQSLKPAGSMKGRKLVRCVKCKHRFYENDNLPRMKVSKQAVVTAISLYYDGLSVRKTARQLESIFGEKVSQVTIWKWLLKYSRIVTEYVKTLAPNLSGLWHHDETMIKCDGRNEWFWEMIDEDTRFLVASHISEDRTTKDTIEVFRKAMQTANRRPQAIFVDGSHTYDRAFNKIFWTRYKVNRVELVKRVGIRARETNNIVERLHETLKERTKIMRGFKNQDSAKLILEGYAVNYNFSRSHLALKGKTPAEQAGIEVKGWKRLIENAIQQEATQGQANHTEGAIEVMQVVQ